jgi:ligand-binding sensor domain-containing protein
LAAGVQAQCQLIFDYSFTFVSLPIKPDRSNICLNSQIPIIQTDSKVFAVTSPQARGHEIRSCCAAGNGGLWFCINGGGFGFFDGQNFSAIDDAKWAVADLNATAILEALDGSVWTRAVRGLGR